MEFHHGGAEVAGRLHDFHFRLDEQRHSNPRIAQFLDGGTQMGVPADDIEPALGGALLTLLGDEAARMRMQGHRQTDPSRASRPSRN